jgi:hypothetical protein
MATSPRLSFKGYHFPTALYRNIDSVKAILAIIAGANFFSGFEYKTFLISLAAGGVALAVKLLADAVDYYFKEVETDE